MSKAPTPKQIVVDVADVDENPDNARRLFDPAKLKTLGASLKEWQQDDIHVRSPAGGRKILVDGARRLRAAKLAGIKQLRAKDWGDVDHQTAVRLAATSALAKEGLTPLEEGRLYQQLLDAKMTKKEIGAEYDVPYNTLESRLELLKLPENLAERIGDQRKGAALGLGHAKAFLPFAQHPKLMQVLLQDVDKAITDEVERVPKPSEFTEFIENSLVKHKLAVRPRDVEHSWEINDIETRAAKEFDTIEIPSRYGNGKTRLILDVAGFKKKAEEWRKVDRAAEAKRNKTSSHGSYGGAMSPAALQADRVKRETRKQQLGLLVKHLKDSKRFGEELQRRIYQDYLQRMGQVAPSLIDRDALKELMGENFLDNGSPNGAIVDKLWKTDRAKLDRFLCAMLYMANKDYQSKIVKKDDVARMATGHTWQHAQGLAERVVNAKKAAKTAKATANLKSGSKAHGEKPAKGRDAKGKPAPSTKAAPAPTKAPSWAELQAYAKKHPGVAPGSAATRKAVEQLTAAQRQALVHDQAAQATKKPVKAGKTAKVAKKPVVESAAVKAARVKLAAEAGTSVVAKGNPAKAPKSQAQLPVGPKTRAEAREGLANLAAPAGVEVVLPTKMDDVELQPKEPSATTVRLQALAAASKESSVPAAAKETPGV